MYRTLLIFSFLLCTCPRAQDSASYRDATAIVSSDTLPHTGRVWIATTGSAVAYTGGILALSNAWYKNYARTPFHFFNDNADWLQADKAGHLYSAYTVARLGNELWRWTGLPRRQRVWLGGLSGTVFLTAVEVLDGYSSGWGFSLGDLAADLAGSGSFIAQELGWGEQRIQLKFSFHRIDYNDPSLQARANELFGSRSMERMLKDYNGQTYWASVNLRSFLTTSRWPRWLNIAVGYGAEGMFGGTENLVRDKNGNIVFNRTDVIRYRQWYLSPDIDLTRIPTKSKVLKAAFFLLNAFKFPAPSIGFSRKGIGWNWIHF